MVQWKPGKKSEANLRKRLRTNKKTIHTEWLSPGAAVSRNEHSVLSICWKVPLGDLPFLFCSIGSSALFDQFCLLLSE